MQLCYRVESFGPSLGFALTGLSRPDPAMKSRRFCLDLAAALRASSNHALDLI